MAGSAIDARTHVTRAAAVTVAFTLHLDRAGGKVTRNPRQVYLLKLKRIFA